MSYQTNRPEKLLVVVSCVALMAPMNAHAYLDPGTGSILLQGLIAAVAGVFITGKLYWARIKSMLGFGPKPDTQDEFDGVSEKRDER